MKAYFANLSPKGWILWVVPAALVAYPIAVLVLPTVIHAVVPDVVRSVLHLM